MLHFLFGKQHVKVNFAHLFCCIVWRWRSFDTERVSHKLGEERRLEIHLKGRVKSD